jgi:hypothetical protein
MTSSPAPVIRMITFVSLPMRRGPRIKPHISTPMLAVPRTSPPAIVDEEQAGCDHLSGEGTVAVTGDGMDEAAELVVQALKVAISDTQISIARIVEVLSLDTYTATGSAVPQNSDVWERDGLDRRQ